LHPEVVIVGVVDLTSVDCAFALDRLMKPTNAIALRIVANFFIILLMFNE